MATYDNIEQIDINESWEGKSGKQVEDLISRRIKQNTITGMTYTGTTLTITKEDGSFFNATVAPIEPTYDTNVILYGFRIDGEDIKTGDFVIQGNKQGRTIEAGIAIRNIAIMGDSVSNINKTFKATISFAGEDKPSNNTVITNVRSIDKSNFTEQGGQVYLTQEGVHNIVWVNITELFVSQFSNGTFQVSIQNPLVSDDLIQHTCSYKITNEVVYLSYNGDIITNQTSISIQLLGSNNSSNYSWRGFVNNMSIATNQITLSPGLNQITIQAYQSDIVTDVLNVDIISTDKFEGTAIAINNVKDVLINNGVATFYELNCYSVDKESVTIDTFVGPDESNLQLAKSQEITYNNYDGQNQAKDITYQKYIELKQSGNQLLKIEYKIGNTTNVYQFVDSVFNSVQNQYVLITGETKSLTVDEFDSKYAYIDIYNRSIEFDQITGSVSTTFNKSHFIDDIETSDTWYENQGLTYLRLSRQNKELLKNTLSLQLSSDFSIEMAVETHNVVDKAQTVLSIGNLNLFPTQLGWGTDTESGQFKNRNSQFQEKTLTHILVTCTANWKLDPNSPYFPDYLGSDLNNRLKTVSQNYSANLIRIYINGSIDREFIITDDDLTSLKNGNLSIYPKGSDINLYLFRVYNQNSLTHQEVVQNFIAFQKEKSDKKKIYNANDIILNGVINWEKCLGKHNTLLFIYHKNGAFPCRFWGQEDNQSDNDKNKKIPCTLIINYADPETNAKYGGILDKLQCKGQGSSAMRYLIWNVNSSLNKFKYKNASGEEEKVKSTFKPYAALWENTDDSNLIPSDMSAIPQSISGYYNMPTYLGQQDTSPKKYKKMVGKVNYASSMQSHKIGACKLYQDAYKGAGLTLNNTGLKAVHEEPFMYFYIETNEDFKEDYSSNLDADSITYAKILELGKQAKFMGFQTWGPGKGDDACSGYDEDLTPEYLLLEGAENKEPVTNFQRPWQSLQRLNPAFVRGDRKLDITQDFLKTPTVSKNDSINDPCKNLYIDDESIFYQNRACWDIDYGFAEVEVGDFTYFDIAESAKSSLKKFREFYDLVYLYDATYETLTVDSLPTNAEGISQDGYSINKKYAINNQSFSINGVNVSGHKSGDVYRYDDINETWVQAGVYYNNTWERLNYKELVTKELGYSVTEEKLIKSTLKSLFKQKVKDYINVEDVAFHQAFIKFISGTDNRAKNTYFQIVGPKKKWDGDNLVDDGGDYKINLIGDDLDTIFVTDNNGLQSKPYNLVEDSYDASQTKYWGDAGNIFFKMFDMCYDDQTLDSDAEQDGVKIKTYLNKIITFSGAKPGGLDKETNSYFYNAFFKVQEDFPQIAYNHTAEIYYENAHVLLNLQNNNSLNYGFEFTNNDVTDPLSQSHGSCLECERQFMNERLNFLNGYAQIQNNELNVLDGSGSEGATIKLKLDFTPVQDFYPTFRADHTLTCMYDSGDSPYNILKHLCRKDTNYSIKYNTVGAPINSALQYIDQYKKLNICGLKTSSISGYFNTTHFTINGDYINDEYFNGYTRPEFDFGANAPVLEELNLQNVKITSSLDLTKYYKLKKINLTGTEIDKVIFPQTGLFEEAILPGVKTFEIINNPALNTVTFEDYTKLETIYIDCSKCEAFNVSDFCKNLTGSLQEVTLLNCDLTLTEATLLNLCKASKARITGTITISDELTFEGKKTLVEKFGNIDDEDNELYIEYTKTKMSVTAPEAINVFYREEGLDNPFDGFIVIGNDVNAINKDNKWYLNVLYFIDGDSNVVVNKYTGQVTFNNSPTIESAVAYIEVNGTKSDEAVVWFTWQRPYVGQFVYNDGSYSKESSQTKELIGIIYDVKESESEGKKTYTAYILGKDLSFDNEEFVSYFTNHFKVENQNLSGVYAEIEGFVNSVDAYFGLKGERPEISTSINVGSINDISDTKFQIIKNLEYDHGLNTRIFVDWVNSNILPRLYNDYSEYIKEIQVGLNYVYEIESIDKLIDLCNALANSKKWNSNSDYNYLNASVLFPYFYAAYLYKPNCDMVDKIANVQWYAPSISELAKIAYLFGYSVTNGSFTDSQKLNVFNAEVVKDGTITYNYPESFSKVQIFTQAFNKLKSYPDAWIEILSTTNPYLSTSVNDGQCYGYVKTITTTYNEYHGSWEAGVYRPAYYSYPGSYDKYELWAYNKRKGGLVFTHITYTEGE